MKRNIPKATHEGVIKLRGTNIPCANLDNGLRVLTQREFLQAIGRSSKAPGNRDTENVADKVPPFLAARNLEPIAREVLTVPTTPVIFVLKGGGLAFGYIAELLPEVCTVYWRAKRQGVLQKNQLHIADQCEILAEALIKVAITALVDEATGYQEIRPKGTLQALLELYLVDHPIVRQTGDRMFPELFYREIYRLNGWNYTPGQTKHPLRVAQITIDVVYRRLQPEIWEQIKVRNPRQNGRRKHYCYQFLSENIGNVHLREHLKDVTRLMKGSSNWNQFKVFLDRFHPICNEVQLDLFFDFLTQSPEDFERWMGMVS